MNLMAVNLGSIVPDFFSGSGNVVLDFFLIFIGVFALLLVVLYVIRKIVARNDPPDDHTLYLP